MPSFGFDTTSEDVVNEYRSKVKGRIFLVTGTSPGGLGAQTALSLARASPAHLVLVSRSKAKSEPVLAELASIDASIKVTFVQCELSDLDSVRQAAEAINAAIPHIDVLINNAGVMNVRTLTRSKQGHELTLASNHFGHFLLTALLMPKIKAAGPDSRVVNLSSVGYRISGFKFEDYDFITTPYDGWTAYGQSKTANILFTLGLATRGVTSFAVHPGSVWDTSLGNHNNDKGQFGDIPAIAKRNTGASNFAIDPDKTLSQGAATTLVAALSPELEAEGKNGAYLVDCQVKQQEEWATGRDKADRLWKLSEDITGQKFDVE